MQARCNPGLWQRMSLPFISANDFDQDQNICSVSGRYFDCMGNLIFKCPRTGMNVQHWLEEPRAGDPTSSYETVVCKACTRLHFINRMTRKLLGEKEQ
ncbi:MAG: hypothetical protein WA418_31380 [Bradyrhizobium sp.]